MNYKKYLILFLSIFILIACKKLPKIQIDNNKHKEDVKILGSSQYEKVMSYDEAITDIIQRDMSVKILRAINDELQNLPDYDIWKIYIS